MKIIVAVCVYDRFKNVEKWVNCWKECNTANAELVIIHNNSQNQEQKAKFKKYGLENSIKYICRLNRGFDIGAFQDVCRNRLPGFPDYDYLLWCTDDVWPMHKEFISIFINKLEEPNIGVSALEISDEWATHIRTNCFCIKKETASKLTFDFDPILTKLQCYGFEHRAGPKTFYNQILSMGLKPAMVSHLLSAPLWDEHRRSGLNRYSEHDNIFPETKIKGDKVVVICPIYNMYPQIISSLICQTHTNWELLLIHNGPELNGLSNIIQRYNDSRLNFIVYPTQTGNWGHPLRAWALNLIKENKLSADADYIIITNADNYYIPTFIEFMLNGFEENKHAVACYCSDMVHSYLKWTILNCKPEYGQIDCGGVMVKKDMACTVGWRSIQHASDWTYFDDLIQKYGVDKWVKINGALFVHN